MRQRAPRGRGARSRARTARTSEPVRRPPAGRGEPERLRKVLARAGLASRREVEAWIRAGRLTVNGEVATLGARVVAGDRISLDGRRVHTHAAHTAVRVFLCHRSPGESLEAGAPAAGALSGVSRPGLLERLPHRAGRRFIAVSPMPRVDGGLELVSSDGELAAQLQRAVHSLTNEFGVRVRGALSESQLQGILGGILDSGARLAVEGCAPAGGEAANRWYTLTARGASGKDVRQLFERQGAQVSRVLRTRLGPLSLERSLGRGHFRELTQEELGTLLPDSGARAG
jgi:23S rRNA pseudouridine2605 synthase